MIEINSLLPNVAIRHLNLKSHVWLIWYLSWTVLPWAQHILYHLYHWWNHLFCLVTWLPPVFPTRMLVPTHPSAGTVLFTVVCTVPARTWQPAAAAGWTNHSSPRSHDPKPLQSLQSWAPKPPRTGREVVTEDAGEARMQWWMAPQPK